MCRALVCIFQPSVENSFYPAASAFGPFCFHIAVGFVFSAADLLLIVCCGGDLVTERGIKRIKCAVEFEVI